MDDNKKCLMFGKKKKIKLLKMESIKKRVEEVMLHSHRTTTNDALSGELSDGNDSRSSDSKFAMTSQPSNESELQLYRVLQRSNLLAYYDTFICQGGDDVQQLCEAGEEEFLEIMALVGMASKPLHVRRLQKALQEWMTNPAMFQSPLQPFPITTPPPIGVVATPQQGSISATVIAAAAAAAASANGGSSSGTGSSSSTALPAVTNSITSSTANSAINSSLKGNTNNGHHISTPSPNQFGGSDYGQPCSPLGMTPVLLERQILRLAEAAECLVKNLPPLDCKQLQNGRTSKRAAKEIETILQMDEHDPRRLEEIRKFSAIYGRFDCKRKPEKPLTLHEVSVNEAAAQLCSKLPALLYRRDELFPLARQVVRDSGYQYSKGHSRSQSCSKLIEEAMSTSAHSSNDSSSGTPNKRIKLDNDGLKSVDNDRKVRHDRLEGIVDQLKSLGSKQEELKSQIQQENEKQNFDAVNELQSELELISDRQIKLSTEKEELEKDNDNDSQFSGYSNDSASQMQETKSTKDPISSPPLKLNDDSCDRGSIKSSTGISDAIEEGLRMIKELNQSFPGEESSLEMRLFGHAGASSSSNVAGSFDSSPLAGTTVSSTMDPLRSSLSSRSRGRPAKQKQHSASQSQSSAGGNRSDNEVSTFYEQIFSQAQLQQAHMLASYQAAALAFGDLNSLSQNLLSNDGQNSTNTNGGIDSGDKTPSSIGNSFSAKSLVDDDTFKLTFV